MLKSTQKQLFVAPGSLKYYEGGFLVILSNTVQINAFDFTLAAMLTVDDDEFWEGMLPVEFGELPALQDAVTVVGYPIGGDTISVTSGVVSRIEILSYVHGSTELLGLQVRLKLLVFRLYHLMSVWKSLWGAYLSL